jgi:hypothetical protein
MHNFALREVEQKLTNGASLDKHFDSHVRNTIVSKSSLIIIDLLFKTSIK